MKSETMTRATVLTRLLCAILITGLLGCSGSSSSSGSLGNAGASGGTTPGVSTGGTSGGSTTPPPAPPPPPNQTIASGTFSALTYNVAGLPQGISSSSPLFNTSQISPMLNNYDLVLAQEDFFYHFDLARDALHPFQSPPLASYSTLAGDGLNRFSQSPFIDFQREKWQTCHGLFDNGSDCLSSKGFSMGRHELAPGVVIDVYNLHADAGGGADDEAARAVQFQQLAQFMLLFSVNNAVIVGGDTNLKAARPNDEQVLQDFMAVTNLRVVARVLNQLPDSIDRFLYRSAGKLTIEPTARRIATEFVDANGQALSDHEAIHVDFRWELAP